MCEGLTLTSLTLGVSDMGFAKYQEDIVSRFVSDQHFHSAVEVSYHAASKQSVDKTAKEKPNMSGLKQFAMAEARPLPIIVLADTSSSMEGADKIGALNAALKDMVDSLTKESRLRADIHGHDGRDLEELKELLVDKLPNHLVMHLNRLWEANSLAL